METTKIESLREIFRKETNKMATSCVNNTCFSYDYVLWLEKGISKEYAKRDKIISVLMSKIDEAKNTVGTIQIHKALE